ncbi:TPA: lysis protein [Klebsiella aerogenes]|uniref:lysis protein n=1 Tax=Klebsiella aerogenes TaxID=548 RepID=UPI00333B948F
MSRVTAIICAVVICLLVSLGFLANHYHTTSTEFKRQCDEKTQALELANATIKDMQTRQRDVAALDDKYTGELADAKANIDQLERDVASGKRRMQLNAKCTANGTAVAGGMGDASGPRLTDSAERDYFTLRERIVTVTKQVGYLQEYVKRQCAQ